MLDALKNLGTAILADFASVNVNFWITPDDANLDPESGGLVVWDKPAPLDWSFDHYNGAPAKIRDFLAQNGARSVTVPTVRSSSILICSTRPAGSDSRTAI